MGVKGYIMQLQPFSVNDGEGIRTTVFIAGCPLRCIWCSNPEGFSSHELVGWYSRKCIGCGACADVCPQGIGIDMNESRDRCVARGRCAEVCPAEARTKLVSWVDADDIIKEVQRHRLFYSLSGGGITFSGGESTAQPEFLNYMTEKLYDLGYSMAIETSGYFEFDMLADSLRRMDTVFMDLKILDPDRHRLYTGVSNEKILANMARLKELDADIVIRIPVIGSVNDDDDNIRGSAVFVRDNIPGATMELLPYHRYGTVKYEALGIPYDHPGFYTPSPERMEELRSIIRSEGIGISDYR